MSFGTFKLTLRNCSVEEALEAIAQATREAFQLWIEQWWI
jgi:hypothetical protein